MAAATKVMDDFAFDIIAQREKEGRHTLTSADKKESGDLLSLYMALRDESGKPLTRRALRYVIYSSGWVFRGELIATLPRCRSDSGAATPIRNANFRSYSIYSQTRA